MVVMNESMGVSRLGPIGERAPGLPSSLRLCELELGRGPWP